MSSEYGGKVSSHWRAYLDYTKGYNGTDDDTYVVRITGAGFQSVEASFSLSSSGVSYTLSGTGQTSKTGNHAVSIGSVSTTKVNFISAFSWSWTKGHSAVTKTIKMAVKNSSGYMNGTSTATLEITVPAKTHYTVSYNANGGSGAPSSQTKWYGETLTLSTTKPTRAGYIFAGWNTNSSGTGTNYSSGGSYAANSGTTLYAKWTRITYTVTYDANGGSSGTVTSQTKTYDTAMTISSNADPSRTNYDFLGWATSPNGTVIYAGGGNGTYTANAAATLYAVWQESYTRPVITEVTGHPLCQRADSGGQEDPEGTYANIQFAFAIDTAHGGVLNTITIQAKEAGTNASYTTLQTLPGSTTSPVDVTVQPSGGFSQSKSYDLQIIIDDGVGSATVTDILSTAFFTMDFRKGGKGVAIGTASNRDGFIIGMDSFITLDYSNPDSDGHMQSGADADLYNALLDLGWVNDVIV